MTHRFYVLWSGGDGTRSWAGPFREIENAKAAVPDGAVAQMIAVPLAVMTPGEKAEALPILDGAA